MASGELLSLLHRELLDGSESSSDILDVVIGVSVLHPQGLAQVEVSRLSQAPLITVPNDQCS